jgi:hypothetical protein
LLAKRALANRSLAQQRKQAVAPCLLADEAKPSLISPMPALLVIPKAEHNHGSRYLAPDLCGLFQSALPEAFKIDQDGAWREFTPQPDRRLGVLSSPDNFDARLSRKEEFEATAHGTIGADEQQPHSLRHAAERDTSSSFQLHRMDRA